MQIGKRMRELLDELGYTQQSMADGLGVSQQAFSLMLQGKIRMKGWQAYIVATGLGVEVEEIFEEDEEVGCLGKEGEDGLGEGEVVKVEVCVQDKRMKGICFGIWKGKSKVEIILT